MLFASAEKLEAALLDRGFDHLAREFVRRFLTGRDGTNRTPRLELTWQLEAGQIPAKRAEIRARIGFENE
jgi:hypothetical protein